MKLIFDYSWLVFLLLLVIYGANVILDEWKRKSIHDRGEMVEVKIERLNCTQKLMSFYFRRNFYQKKIDARTCVLFNEGQRIKLKHSDQYATIFLFANERSPNLFIQGGLEIALGILGILANWPFMQKRRSALKNFPRLSEN